MVKYNTSIESLIYTIGELYPIDQADELMHRRFQSRIAIILPTYCEAENIADIIYMVEDLKLNSTILVIDDSSPDGTQDIVEKLQQVYHNIVLLVRPCKKGLGTAIVDGFRFLMSRPNPPSFIITMDADRSHDPKEIPKLLETAEDGYDLVIGSRYCPDGKVKGWGIRRVIISKVANKITRTIIKLPLNDFTSGFRCYSKEYVEKTVPRLHCQTYEIQIETIRQAKIQNSKVTEVPITFENRKKGKSKLTLNEILTFFKYILRVFLEQTLTNI